MTMPLPTLKSGSYKNARKSLDSNAFHIKRTKTLLKRVMTRIEKINLYLGQEELGDKELKAKISLLSQLLGVKKQLLLEIKELAAIPENSSSSLSDILNTPSNA